MREIEFRALRLQPQIWVYGLYFKSGNGQWTEIQTENGACFYVQEETISQYTGLKDKNDKKIYEGHIVAFKHDTRTGGGYTRLMHNAAIEYGGNGGEYMTAGYAFRFKDAKGNEVVHQLDWLKARNIEVIGNIYENPELLGDSQ
ncbi:YopX family protein [Lysinibacillus sphaericus]|uniref:YopX family protein n=1 Tax=Lysinibacillus sphaericus TaxID=1421 RepID=UPI0018CED523|nr:YopX family protein [Lysinibacillus sphaericus]